MNFTLGRPGILLLGRYQEVYCGGGGGDDGFNDHHMPVGAEREYMFDKVMTPSDVGKLNRLVIPKQHAEKYFPLNSSATDKGLLLNFEDRHGKPWQFRYSYWNSSQSYVMTKGWSRFVKDKKLDAGDIISFQRGIGEPGKDRLFIDWRRRLDHMISSIPSQFDFRNCDYSHSTEPHHHYHHPSYTVSPRGSIMYLSSAGPGDYGPRPHPQAATHADMVIESVPPVVQGKAAAKRLRLFGVNMDCSISESGESDVLSSTSLPIFQHLPPMESSPSIKH